MQSNSFAKNWFLWQALAAQMRTLLLQFIAGSLFFLTACQKRAETPVAKTSDPAGKPAAIKMPEDDLLVTFRSKGRHQRSAATNLTAFLEIAALPQTDEVVTGVVARVATLLARSDLSSNLVTSVGIPALSSVLNAVIEFDSIGELRQLAGGALSATIALRTSDEQHASLTSGLAGSVSNALTVARNGSWTLLTTLGTPSPSALTNRLEKLVAQGEAIEHSTNWLDITANLQKLGSSWLMPSGSVSNNLRLTVSPRNDGFRTEVHLTSDRPFDLQLDSWNVPTNTIRDPLIGFTAVRGISRWIQEQPVSRTMGLSNAPNQAFLWSQAISPFSVSAAAPFETPKEIVSAVVEKLLPSWRPVLAALGVGTFEVNTNASTLKWQKLPVIVPFLSPAPAPETNFIYAGLFPVANLGTKAPPAELIEQITSRTNLLYYDWEITSDRVNQWRQISQVISIIKNEFSGDTNLLSDRWLDHIQARLGNCVTEMTLSNPRELIVSRRSAIGLSSLELVSLARWLDPVYVPRHRGKKSSPTVGPLAPTP